MACFKIKNLAVSSLSAILCLMAVEPAWSQCQIPKADGVQNGDVVLATGVSSLRAAPPQGSFGTLGAAVGATKAGQAYTVDDKRCVNIVFFGRQLWLHLKGGGWGLSGTDDNPFEYFTPKS